MTTPYAIRLCALIALVRVAAPATFGQTSTTRPQASPAENAPLTLDPFVVPTDRDNSYGATNSNSVTRFNVDLFKAPVVADIFTKQFIDDSGFTTLEDLMRTYGNGAGMQYATPSSDSTNGVGNLTRYSSSQFSIRGLSAGNPRRDGFQYQTIRVSTNGLWDVDRVDVIHGSQGLLYGASGGGGIINLVSKEGKFNNVSAEVSGRLDQYGSKIGTVDYNWGNDWLAVRVVANDEHQQSRFLYVGDTTHGFLGSVSFKLPLHTTVRIEGEKTRAKILNSSTTTVNFGGTSIDPRSGDTLTYLLATNQLGATNPLTGAPYPGGAVDNGHVTSGDIYSFGGGMEQDNQNNWLGQIVIDTNWSKNFSTSIGFQQDRGQEMRNANSSQLISPNINGTVIASNPLNTWVVSHNLGNSESDKYYHQIHISGLLTNELFGGKAKSQTSFGWDRIYDNETGGIPFNYYQADANGHVAFDPSLSAGGRVNSPLVYWDVSGGPVQYPYSTPGAASVLVNGVTYVRMPGNPRSAAWITPNNPLGLASLYANSLNHSTTNANGISGGNSAPYANHERDQGYYLVNYTGWFNDAVTTMVGARISDQFLSNANTVATLSQPYVITRTGNLPSYNLGADFAIPHVKWLRGYAEFSKTFNVLTNAASSTDAYGDLPTTPIGYTYEAGLKFQTADLRLSGSLSAYSAYTEGDLYSAANFKNLVNPLGISGIQVVTQAAPNNFAPLNKTSQGLELVMTAAPNPNWRIRFSADVKDGTIDKASTYQMNYNDQFYTDGKGNVTYANGQPFLVPTDATTLAKVLKQANPVDPTTYGVPLTPLTVAMINTPASPYYAFGQGTTAQNQPINGAILTPVLGAEGPNYLAHALEWFNNANTFAYTGAVGLPASARQYDFADPAGFNGSYAPEKAGSRVVGSPVLAANLFSMYTFSEGWLKGLGVGGGVSDALWTAQYYFLTPDSKTHLFAGPLAPYETFNGLLTYSRKFGRVRWTSKLNIQNMFNHYILVINPNNGTGYNTPANANTTFYGSPRTWVWTNTLNF